MASAAPEDRAEAELALRHLWSLLDRIPAVMKLRRVEVRGFRRLAEPVCIDGIGDGLTVVAGDNEEGKSTLLAALKAALFEHHTVGGSVREAMSPHTRAVPEVAVDFELRGGRYELRKSFKKGGVSLATPRGRLADDAAEVELRELLRFERRTKQVPDARNLGLQAVFWVEQGTTFSGFDCFEGGQERLSAAIEAEVGGVSLGGRGRQLLDLIETRGSKLLDEAGAKSAACSRRPVSCCLN